MAHTCNPHYLRDWNQEDDGLRPAQVEKFVTPSSTEKTRRDGICLSSQQEWEV
jgi:hypothetical protein